MNVDLPTSTDTPMGRCLTEWKAFLRGEPDALERIVADDAVLHSPVLYKPQRGKDLVIFYLTGASMAFPGDANSSGSAPAKTYPHPELGEWDGKFRYVRTVIGERDAVLEFETVMDGTYVNGADMITCDDDGRITDFKVMVRPLRALDAVRNLMTAALDQIKEPTP